MVRRILFLFFYPIDFPTDITHALLAGTMSSVDGSESARMIHSWVADIITSAIAPRAVVF